MGSDVADMVDVAFDLGGSAVPSGYAFTLWHEIVRVLPWLETEITAGVIPLRGSENGDQILLAKRSKLVLRLPSDGVAQAMALCGRELHIGFSILSIGAGKQRALQPHATLHSHLVEASEGEEAFMEGVGLELREMGVNCSRICGRQAILSAGKQSVHGYSLVLHELRPEESLQVQRAGLGGSRHFGCGIFVPYKTIAGLE